MVKHESRVTSCELRVTSWKLKRTSWNSKARAEIQKHELKFESTSYEFESTSSSFPTTISLKLFGNLWDNLCGQFLVIISCFAFPLLWKKRPKFSTEKSPSPRWFWRNLLFPLVNVTDFSFIFLTQIFVLCL